MRTASVMFLLGILFTLKYPYLFNFALNGTALICALILLAVSGYCKRWIGIWTSCCLLGFAGMAIKTTHGLNQLWPHAWENIPIHVQAKIVSIPMHTLYGMQFIANINAIKWQDKWERVDQQVKLSSYPPRNVQLHVGQQWQWDVKLKRPHTLSNPGSFDVVRSFLEKRLVAQGTIIRASRWYPVNLALSHFNINYLREKLYVFIQQTLISYPNASLIAALAIGETQMINPSQWEVMRKTGTNHLMAISGLHIGLVAGLVSKISMHLLRWFPRLLLIVPLQQGAIVIGCLAATMYAVLAGLSIPTQRALIMVWVLLCAQLLRRQLMPMHHLALALMLILLWDPFSVFVAGFWLSFMAVFWIHFSLMQASDSVNQSTWRQALRIQTAVTLGLIPFTGYFFQQTATYSVIANIIAIPWVSFLVVPVALIASLLNFISHDVSSTLFKLAAESLQVLWYFLEWIASWPHALIHFNVSLTKLGILQLATVAWLLNTWRYRLLAMGLLSLILKSNPNQLAAHHWRLDVLEVGQGLSVVIQTPHHRLMYDTGPSWGENSAAQKAILPYLYTQKINRLDALIISHSDNDHSGGLNAIAAAFPIKHIYASYFPLKFHSITSLCQQGISWQWDGITFRFLAPDPRSFNQGNNSSCVLQIDDGHHRVLLPGDIEKKAEQILVQNYQHQLKSDVLIVPHHGSKSSSSEPFIRMVQPTYAVMSTGYLNRFHFPHPTVMERYQRIGVKLFNTSETGMMKFEFNSDKSHLKVTLKHIIY